MNRLTKAINNFSVSLHLELAKDQGNVLTSPFIISTALSMLLCSARGSTEREVRKVLHLESVSITNSEVQNCLKEFLSSFRKSSDNVGLAFASAVLSEKDIPLSPEFRETVEKGYHALLLEVDFAGENKEALRQINEWVKKNTNGMIEEFVQSLDPSALAVILTAIYFKGLWEHPFKPEFTTPKIFYNRGFIDEGKEVPMMNESRTMFQFVRKKTYKALELSYQNVDIVMLLLLPNELDGVQNLENLLTADLVKKTMDSLDYKNVSVTIPKLHIEYGKELSQALIELGMNHAFHSKFANFSGISDISFPNVFIGQFLTRCMLIINEEGTEAAAAADIVYTRGVSKRETFVADHPFLFVIYDKEKDVILFIGRIAEL